MKIGISLLNARPQRTGVENAAFNLVTQLGGMNDEDEYVVYADRRNLPWLSELPKRIRIVDVRLSCGRSLWTWEHLFFLTSQRPREVDAVHFPLSGAVVGYRRKFVVTIHDMKHFFNRELVKLRRHLLWRVWCNANLHRAAKIIAVSEYVKRDILRQFPLSPDSIRVIPNGVDQRFKPTVGSKLFRAKYQLPERYVLFVGQTTTNKNIRRAIDGVTLMRHRYGLDHQFIVAGIPGEDDAMLKKYVDSNNLWETVRFLGYVHDNVLSELYANADVFLFPSITEGFGIPPLEAMRCGIPVVAARTSCLPEVLGDAPIWVDPLSIDSIAEGLAAAVLNKSVRTRAIANGLSRGEQFSWERMASDTVSVYREVTSQLVRDSGIAAISNGRVSNKMRLGSDANP